MALTQLQKAIAYAESGIKVFPCGKNKSPLTKSGFKSASKNVDQIVEWWSKHPNAMIGAPNDQFTVVDIDDYDLCPTGKLLTSTAVHRLHEQGIIVPQCMKVKTLSGGTHVYFKKSPLMSRMINCLPNIDLLAGGGYSILPDQENYVADVPEPWNHMKCLPDFRFDEFSYLIDEFDGISQEAKRLKNGDKSPVAPVKKVTDTAKHGMRTDIEGYKEALKEAEAEDGKRSNAFVHYEHDRIEFIEEQGIYTSTKKTYKKADHNDKILGSDGMVKILGDGKLNSEIISRLFYNRQVQERLARFLGLKVPHGSSGTINRSIFAGHTDRRPSMGLRWSQDGSHLIARDFSNFYGNKYGQNDYNLVRLFACTMYKGNVQRMSPTEFVVWFTRLLVDAGVLDPKPFMKDFYKSLDGLTEKRRKVAESFQLLFACKSMWDGFDGTTTFSDKFSCAWTGVSIKSIGPIKAYLVDARYFEYVGVYDCSGGRRSDNFYHTPLYQMVTEPSTKIHIAGHISNKDVRELKKQRREAMKIETATTGGSTKNEKNVQEKYPSLGTVFKLNISDDYYQTIVNFCEDFGIPNVVLKKNMICPILISDSFIEDVEDDKDVKYFMGDLQLVVDDESLILVGSSPAYDDLWKRINRAHWDKKSDFMEESIPHFIISYDIEGKEFDTDKLQIKLSEYVGGVIGMNNLSTMYLDEDQIDALVDGVEPDYDEVD